MPRSTSLIEENTMNKTTYLEPPLETLYHTDFRGLLRFCNIEDGYLLTLTLERRDDSGRWVQLKTQVASPDFFAQEFEALVHTVGADESFTPQPLPCFAVVDGEPKPVPANGKPTQLRDALQVLFRHYFEDEKRHYQSVPIKDRDNHVFEHWVAVFNCLTGRHCSPESLLPEAQPATRVPVWLTLLVLTLLLPTLLYLPAFLNP